MNWNILKEILFFCLELVLFYGMVLKIMFCMEYVFVDIYLKSKIGNIIYFMLLRLFDMFLEGNIFEKSVYYC